MNFADPRRIQACQVCGTLTDVAVTQNCSVCVIFDRLGCITDQFGAARRARAEREFFGDGLL